MNGSMREAEDVRHRWLTAALVVGLTVVPMLLPLFGVLHAADSRAPGDVPVSRNDHDGVHDLSELGGTDEDGDGRVDGFVDIVHLGDGMDDGTQVVPLVASDANGNGLADHLDPFAPDPDGGAQPMPVDDGPGG